MQTTAAPVPETSLPDHGRIRSDSSQSELKYTTRLDRAPEHWDLPQLASELLGLEQLIHQWSMVPNPSRDAEQLLQELKRAFPKTFRTPKENELRANVFWNSEGWESCEAEFADMLRDGLSNGKDWGTCLREFRRDIENRFGLNDENDTTNVRQVVEIDDALTRSTPTDEKRAHNPLTVVGLQEEVAALTAHGDCSPISERQRWQFQMSLRDTRLRTIHARRIAQSQRDATPCALSKRDHCEQARPARRAYRLATLVLPERLFRTVGR